VFEVKAGDSQYHDIESQASLTDPKDS